MKRIRSLANNPRLERHEKPKRASEKKKIPRKVNKQRGDIRNEEKFTKSILETGDVVAE
jgi:hypothetical protein